MRQQTEKDAIRATRKEDKLSLEQLTQHYMEVSQCWVDPDKAIERKMSVERALSTLRNVRDIASCNPNGKRLAMYAHKLLMDIVDKQVEPQFDS